MFAGGTCSAGSSTSTTDAPHDRIWVFDPHGLGIALARSRMVPALLGWLLAAYPLGIAALLSVYPMGIALGLLWAAVAWVATQSSRRAEPLG